MQNRTIQNHGFIFIKLESNGAETIQNGSHRGPHTPKETLEFFCNVGSPSLGLARLSDMTRFGSDQRTIRTARAHRIGNEAQSPRLRVLTPRTTSGQVVRSCLTPQEYLADHGLDWTNRSDSLAQADHLSR